MRAYADLTSGFSHGMLCAGLRLQTVAGGCRGVANKV